jgi:hypothetical protein
MPLASACRRCAANEETADKTLLSAPAPVNSGSGDIKEPRMRLAIIRLVLITAALSAAIAPLRAEVRILASPGGQVGPFLDMFDRVRESGERVVIDGPCCRPARWC